MPVAYCHVQPLPVLLTVKQAIHVSIVSRDGACMIYVRLGVLIAKAFSFFVYLYTSCTSTNLITPLGACLRSAACNDKQMGPQRSANVWINLVTDLSVLKVRKKVFAHIQNKPSLPPRFVSPWTKSPHQQGIHRVRLMWYRPPILLRYPKQVLLFSLTWLSSGDVSPNDKRILINPINRYTTEQLIMPFIFTWLTRSTSGKKTSGDLSAGSSSTDWDWCPSFLRLRCNLGTPSPKHAGTHQTQQ